MGNETVMLILENEPKGGNFISTQHMVSELPKFQVIIRQMRAEVWKTPLHDLIYDACLLL